MLDTFGPAWIDAPLYNWLTPDPGLSQWITPEVVTTDPNGWYIYRTPILVPAATPGYPSYLFTAIGKVATDNDTRGIALGYGRNCALVSIPAPQGLGQWADFSFEAAVAPSTPPYLYFLTYNVPINAVNPTGLLVEFTSAYFTPK